MDYKDYFYTTMDYFGLQVGLVTQRLRVGVSGPAGIVGGGLNDQR